MNRLVVALLALAGVALGVAAIVFGEADDAPGAVLIGLVLIVGTLAFTFVPALRRRSRVLGVVLAAMVLCVATVGVAGWLENVA